MEKNNSFSIIALVAMIMIVGMVVAFAVSSKGNAQSTSEFTFTKSSGATNSAGMMRASQCDSQQGQYCGPCSADGDRWECNGGNCYIAHDVC